MSHKRWLRKWSPIVLLAPALLLGLGCALVDKNQTTPPLPADTAEAAVGVTATTTGRTGRPPDQSIFKAAARGDLRAIQQFANEGGGFDLADTQGLTLLMFACRRGQIDIVRYLVQNGANVDSVDRDQTAVIHYASESPNREIARLILQAGADASVSDRFGYNSLLKWAERMDWTLIEEALAHPERLKQLDELKPRLTEAAKNASQLRILEALK